MWMNYLRLGSIVMLCGFSSACNASRSEWVHHGEWVYRNESSRRIEIEGAIVSFATMETGAFELVAGDGSYRIDFRSEGDKDISPDAIGLPFEYHPDIKCRITIDGTIMIPLLPDAGIRERNNYRIEKLGMNHFQFTYTFTDEILSDLVNSQRRGNTDIRP